ncbi:MAG: hypothetical protein GY756_09815 [bacterium]|nr:hypothetical protein [bacterium]
MKLIKGDYGKRKNKVVKMKIKITGDSDKPYLWKVINLETGELVEGIDDVTINIMCGIPTAKINFKNIDFDINCDIDFESSYTDRLIKKEIQ